MIFETILPDIIKMRMEETTALLSKEEALDAVVGSGVVQGGKLLQSAPDQVSESSDEDTHGDGESLSDSLNGEQDESGRLQGLYLAT